MSLIAFRQGVVPTLVSFLDIYWRKKQEADIEIQVTMWISLAVHP